MKFNEIYEGLLQGKKYRLNYWYTGQYIYFDDNTSTIRSANNDEYKLNASQIMVHDTWEEYVEPVDYEKCIGCLCEFWSDNRFSYRSIGILTKIYDNIEHKFANQMDINYKYCKPIKPEEIKFYKGEE